MQHRRVTERSRSSGRRTAKILRVLRAVLRVSSLLFLSVSAFLRPAQPHRAARDSLNLADVPPTNQHLRIPRGLPVGEAWDLLQVTADRFGLKWYSHCLTS